MLIDTVAWAESACTTPIARWHSRFDVSDESGILVLRAHDAWVRACAALASAMLVGAVLAVREPYSRHQHEAGRAADFPPEFGSVAGPDHREHGALRIPRHARPRGADGQQPGSIGAGHNTLWPRLRRGHD